MQYQGFTGDREQQFARQTCRRIPRGYDYENVFWGIFPVLLHGLLDYLLFRQMARRGSLKFAVACRSAKLICVQEQEIIAEYAVPQSPPVSDVTLAEPSPNDPPWGVWAAVGVWFASVLFILILPNLFLLPYLLRQTIDFTDKDTVVAFVKSDSTAIVLQLLAIIPAHILTIVLAWLVVTRFRKYSFRKMLGWEWNGFRIWHAVAIFLAFYGFAILMSEVLGSVDNDFDKLIKTSRAAVYLVAFFATFTAPIVEEVVYRGLLFSAFQKKFGMWLAIISVTLLFTLVHVPQYSTENTVDYATISTLLLLSLSLTIIRAHTGNLLPCIVLHTIVNGVQSVLLIAEPYLPKALTDGGSAASFIHHVFK